jgi:hypothetical protein
MSTEGVSLRAGTQDAEFQPCLGPDSDPWVPGISLDAKSRHDSEAAFA